MIFRNTSARRRQQALAWTLYILEGATKNLSKWVRRHARQLTPTEQDALNGTVQALIEAAEFTRAALGRSVMEQLP